MKQILISAIRVILTYGSTSSRLETEDYISRDTKLRFAGHMHSLVIGVRLPAETKEFSLPRIVQTGSGAHVAPDS
jgi:hypothetical protein